MTDQIEDEPEKQTEAVEDTRTGMQRRLDALAKNRVKTQFGGEKANPHHSEIPGANKPWSVRNAIRHLAAQRIDTTDPKAPHKLLRKNSTMAEMIALNVLIKATKADMRAAEYVTEQIDGKLAQTNVNADFAAIQEMSDDEILAYIERCQAFVVGLGGGDDGDREANGGEEYAENEAEQAGTPDDTSGL